MGFLDGEACTNICGKGAYIVINTATYYHFCWNS